MFGNSEKNKEMLKEKELEAFNTDVKLAEFHARVERGELTEDEQHFLDSLLHGDPEMNAELAALFDDTDKQK